MPTYCLSCELTPQNSDLAQAAWYGHSGLFGCQEETVGDKVRLKCYFKDLSPSTPPNMFSWTCAPQYLFRSPW